MSLYLGTTEITKLRGLAPQTGLDITDIWFGSTNVYTVWQVYEGTLPATIISTGDNLRQYQIWGNVGGVGDRTVQLFDKDTALDGYEIKNNEIQENENWCISDFIPVESDTLYKSRNSGGTVISYTDKSSQPTRLSGTLNRNGVITLSETKFIRMNCQISQKANCIVAKSDDLPETFVPFGYEVDIGVKSENLLNFNALRDAPSGKIGNTTISHLLVLTLAPNTEYTLVSDGTGSTSGTGDGNRSIYINTLEMQNCVFAEHPVQITTDATGVIKIAFLSERTNAQQYINGTAHVWLVKGSDTLPYQPYFSTVIPIYIGNPLEKDEYVDYQAGKIYRMVDGTLIPTDPPVPLPALPTCEGTTVIDYAGQSVAPEKVILKYRKEGF